MWLSVHFVLLFVFLKLIVHQPILWVIPEDVLRVPEMMFTCLLIYTAEFTGQRS